jgi:hypothetical protein
MERHKNFFGKSDQEMMKKIEDEGGIKKHKKFEMKNML